MKYISLTDNKLISEILYKSRAIIRQKNVMKDKIFHPGGLGLTG